MHPANQRPGKPDKLSQGAYNQTGYPKVQWGNILNKRGDYRIPAVRVREERTTATTEGNIRSRNKIKNIGLLMWQEARNKA